MLQIQAKENKCIDLGRRGEDSAREILFDISGWAEMYGQGEAQLIAKRDRDLTTYPAIITQNNTTVSWVIKPVDNDQPGYGNCELVYITDGKVVKSSIYQTHTDVSLSDPVSPPDSPSTYGSLVKRIEALENNASEPDGSANAVQYVPQELTEQQQTQARKNIGAVSIEDIKQAPDTTVLYTEQELTEEQKAQARKNIGADFASVRILETDPAEPKEGMMWILRTTTEELSTPVIEPGEVGENSIAIKLSNASFDGSGAVVASYNIYVNGELTKTENIEPGGTCTVTELSAGTDYRISVRGVKGTVLSEASNTLTARTAEGEIDAQEIVIVLGHTIGTYDNKYGVSLLTNVSRAVAVATGGKQEVPPTIDGVHYYMVEVPDHATSCTVVCPNMMWGYNGWNTGSDGKLTYDVDSGWTNSGATYSFEAGVAEYVSIGFKRTDSGTVTAEDIAGITITFA